MIKAVWICVGNFVLSSFLFVNNRKKMSKWHNIFTKQKQNSKLFFWICFCFASAWIIIWIFLTSFKIFVTVRTN
jgi:hypothetical protein